MFAALFCLFIEVKQSVLKRQRSIFNLDIFRYSFMHCSCIIIFSTQITNTLASKKYPFHSLGVYFEFKSHKKFRQSIWCAQISWTSVVSIELPASEYVFSSPTKFRRSLKVFGLDTKLISSVYRICGFHWTFLCIHAMQAPHSRIPFSI